MTGAAAVLVCVLDLLGRSASSFPPIELVASRPPDVSANTEAFVREGSGTITVIVSTAAFRDANCDNRRSMLKLASILAHEEYHVRHGADERKAYEAQLGTLLRLGEAPDSGVYFGVLRAMNTVLRSKEQAAAAARLKQEGALAAAERVP